MTNDPALDGIPCMLMRGGTSKGAFFLKDDLPADPAERDALVLNVMGSPDPRQVDGIGGAHPLTSKVAVVSASDDDDVDVDYLFLQVSVETAEVSTAQTCGNLLAAVGPFAVERGLVAVSDGAVSLRIRLVNTGGLAVATLTVKDGRVRYAGHAAIPGVPGTAASIDLATSNAPNSPVLPSGNVVDSVSGHEATLIDAGMPAVVLDAAEFGLTGAESVEHLESSPELASEVEEIRLAAGRAMGLADVTEQSVPKMFLVSPPQHDGALSSRVFIPHRVHTSIGVLMASSLAAAVQIPGTVAHKVAGPGHGPDVRIEHPSGTFAADVEVTASDNGWTATTRNQRTARKLFDGRVFAHEYP